MAKGSGGINRGGRFQGRVTGGRVRVGKIASGARVFRPGDSLSGSGFTVNKVNSATFGVITSGGGAGRIRKSDLSGGFVLRGSSFTRIR